MKREIILRLHQDDGTGEYGLAHEESFNGEYSIFNAFWNGIGIFHDVFEHYFEGKHKYFLDDYSFNVAGEIAAMVHMAYYIENYDIRLARRLSPSSFYTDEQNIVLTTQSMIEESVSHGYCNFGDELKCKVPKQTYHFNDNTYVLDEVINEHIYGIEKIKKEASFKGHKEDRERARIYKKSITKSKIKNLYLWGYKQAKKIVPDLNINAEAIQKFISYWNDFCKLYNAEELSYYYSNIVFHTWLNKNKELKWSAKFVDKYTGQHINHNKIQF